MQKFMSKMKFVSKFPFLQNFTKTTLLKLISNFKYTELKKNNFLFKQGEKFTHVYLIVCGEFIQSRKSYDTN